MVKFHEVTLNVSIFYNTVLETLRAVVGHEDTRKTFAEEGYAEEFALFRSLQLFVLNQQKSTVFASLEMNMLITRLLDV